jgi:dihydrofolate reductase
LKDVRLGGGVSTIRQYLQARLIDQMHVAISPVMLGKESTWSFGRRGSPEPTVLTDRRTVQGRKEERDQ